MRQLNEATAQSVRVVAVEIEGLLSLVATFLLSE